MNLMLYDDIFYMKEALHEADAASAADEVPIGAVVVDAQGIIIGRGFNQVERLHTQAAHAEIVALQAASVVQKDWRFDGSTLYVTLEPCGMCMAFLEMSRIARVVYGAPSPLFGYRLDKTGDIPLYKRNVIVVAGGVLADEAGSQLREFFLRKRKERRE